jgi:hypothetical protein
MFNNKKEIPYDKTKEFLTKQQDIDTLLVLVRILEAPMTDLDIKKVAEKKISNILERIQ